MKHYESKTSIRLEHTSTTCDSCKKTIDDEFQCEPMQCLSYNHDRTIKYNCELCADCFEEKIIPWLKSQNIDFRIIDIYQ